jgi:hypothetical protein
MISLHTNAPKRPYITSFDKLVPLPTHSFTIAREGKVERFQFIPFEQGRG